MLERVSLTKSEGSLRILKVIERSQSDSAIVEQTFKGTEMTK